MDGKLVIQWYPGHMVKAKRMVKEHLKLVDVVIEIVDARVPLSSRNPDLEKITIEKPRIVVLNKADLANEQATTQWLKYFRSHGYGAVAVNSITGQGLSQVIQIAKKTAEEKLAKMAAKGMRPRAVRALIVGIPNVGKSSIINKLVGKVSAKTGDRPGVTKGKQWVRINPEFELLDTPGILWPKFEDPEIGLKLAFTGAISDVIMDIEELGYRLLAYLRQHQPEALAARYKLTDIKEDPVELMDQIGAKRGCLISGGRIDRLKVAILILDEFRASKLGRITLDEIPEEIPVETPETTLESISTKENSTE